MATTRGTKKLPTAAALVAAEAAPASVKKMELERPVVKEKAVKEKAVKEKAGKTVKEKAVKEKAVKTVKEKAVKEKAVKTVKAVKAVKEKEVSHKEVQVAHFCHNHSLNHVLQEGKTVWYPNKPFLLAANGKAAPADATAKDPGVKLNIWAYCKERGLAYLRAQRAEYLHEDAKRLFRQLDAGEPSLESEYYKNPVYAKDFARDLAHWKGNQKKYGGKSVEEIVAMLDKSYGKDESLKQLEDGGIGCTMTGSERGDLPYAWFRGLFDMLGYEYIEVDDLNYKKAFTTNYADPQCLGMVINQGAWHYVSVPKYVVSSDCPPSKFVLADSLNRSTVYECHNKRELMTVLDRLPLTRAYFIFARDGNAYQSVAVKRMMAKMGRKRKTRKM